MCQVEFDKVIYRKGTGCKKWDGHVVPANNQERSVLRFTIADMDFEVPACITNALKTRVEHPVFGYSFPEESLIDAFAGWMQRRHGVALENGWIKAVTGVITGLAFAIRSVVSEGDRVLVFTPVYAPFFRAIESSGCELVECPLKKDKGHYCMDLDAVEAEMKRGLKAILFCNPHNPVGRVWTRRELEDLVNLCLKYNVYLFSDEAHADFALFGHEYTPMSSFAQLGGLAVSCVSPNKSFNIPGLGIAFLVCRDTNILAKASEGLRDIWITSPNIFAMVAAEAGYNQADEWLDAAKHYIESNSMRICNYIRTYMPQIIPAVHEGTFLLWLDVSCFKKSSVDLAKELEMKYGVQLSAGAEYRGNGNEHLRFNIAASREILDLALERMLNMYKAYFGDG